MQLRYELPDHRAFVTGARGAGFGAGFAALVVGFVG